MLGGNALKTELLCNNHSVKLNNFTQKYIADIVASIAKSLGSEPEEVILIVGENGVSVKCDDKQLKMEKDFVGNLILNTVKGMLSPLKGILWGRDIIITVKYRNKKI